MGGGGSVLSCSPVSLYLHRRLLTRIDDVNSSSIKMSRRTSNERAIAHDLVA